MDGQNSPSWYPRECSQKGQSFCSERILPARNPETRRGVYRRWALGHPSLPGASKAHTSAGVGKDQSRYEKFRMKSNHAKSLCLTPVPTITNTPPTWGQTVASSSQRPPPHQSFVPSVQYSAAFSVLCITVKFSLLLSLTTASSFHTMMDLVSRFLTISE